MNSDQLKNPNNARSPLRCVCVIGMGPIGNLHADIYKGDALAQLVGVCDIVPERAEAAGERLGVPWFTDAAKMLAELKPDLCSVATGGYEYSSDHYLPTLQALRAGCHVLCEKPICNEIAKAEEMVRVARELKRCSGGGPQPPFHPRRPAGQKLAGRRPHRQPALHQHGAVDRPAGQFRFAVLPSEGAEPALG